MSDGLMVDSLGLLRTLCKNTGRSFVEVSLEYGILLRPMPTDIEGRIRYLESVARLHGELAESYTGPPVCESKRNQRKLLFLRYFSERDRATSLDVSRNMNLPLTNVSERLRRYYKQGLLAREALERRKRGRRTMVYKLTETGRRRLAFLEKNVRFKRAETEASKEYRKRQKMMEMLATALRQRAQSNTLQS